MGARGNGCPWRNGFYEQTLKIKTLVPITASVTSRRECQSAEVAILTAVNWNKSVAVSTSSGSRPTQELCARGPSCALGKGAA